MDLTPRGGDIVASFEDLVFAAASAMVFVGPQPPASRPPSPVNSPEASATDAGMALAGAGMDVDNACTSLPPPPNHLDPDLDVRAVAAGAVHGAAGVRARASSVSSSGAVTFGASRSSPDSPFEPFNPAILGEVKRGAIV